MYPAPPFSPPERYAEFAGATWLGEEGTDAANSVYARVRESLVQLGLDAGRAGTAQWNPFGKFVKPGQRVVLKPNFVKGSHPLGEPGVLSMITHASVMRPLIDYVLLATGGKVHITICDVPLQSSVWEDILERSGTRALISWYAGRGVAVEALDLRREISTFNEENVIATRDYRDRDPLGYAAVDLARRSALMPIIADSHKLEITDYPYSTVGKHHNEERNEYLIARTILAADFFINVPKLKTHKKTGITVAMKNLIGINGDKSWIAHHRRGSPAQGGDEFPKAQALPVLQFRLFNALKSRPATVPVATALKKIFRKFVWGGRRLEEVRMTPSPTGQVYEGGWYGNDTVWRCVLDLNNVIFFADRDGNLHESPQRAYLCVVDGILAGEREGPMEQTPKEAGLVLAGVNPVAVDFASAVVMGFDPMQIPALRGSIGFEHFGLGAFSAADVELTANYGAGGSGSGDARSLGLGFIPPVHWRPVLAPELKDDGGPWAKLAERGTGGDCCDSGSAGRALAPPRELESTE